MVVVTEEMHVEIISIIAIVNDSLQQKETPVMPHVNHFVVRRVT